MVGVQVRGRGAVGARHVKNLGVSKVFVYHCAVHVKVSELL